MDLPLLIRKLETAAKKYERKVWKTGSSDLESLDLHEMLSEAAKELKRSAPNR